MNSNGQSNRLIREDSPPHSPRGGEKRGTNPCGGIETLERRPAARRHRDDHQGLARSCRSLPFIEIVGNGLTYNRENAAATAAFYDVGDTWTESTPTFTQITATLKIVGGDADIDNFLLATRSNVQDLRSGGRPAQGEGRAAEVRGHVRQRRHQRRREVVRRHRQAVRRGGQIATMGANGATLTLAKLDELIDLVKGGKPDILLMSKRTRRTLNNLARTAGSFLRGGPQRVRPDGAVLRRHARRHLRLHLRREDRRHQQRLLDGLRHAVSARARWRA